MTRQLFVALCCNFLLIGQVLSVEQYLALKSLSDLSLEELMDIDITIANKKTKKLNSVASPVFVITADDIRRSGANNVPEVLRMVPGVQVAKIGPHDWSVNIRGFNGLLSNKLLVSVNGRTIYNSFNAGTYWRDIQSLALDDIKQIEIIRGPGGTIWGANAVNGVINIITYSALEDDGGRFIAAGGTEQRAFTSVTYSKKINNAAALKAYVNYFNVDNADNLEGFSNEDGGEGWRTGIRFDFDNAVDKINIDGDWHEHSLQYNSLLTLQTAPFYEISNHRTNYNGGHFLAKWDHQVAEDNHWSLQAFYDYNHLNDVTLPMDIGVWDIEFNHQFNLLDHHTITWGTGYRYVLDEERSNLTIRVNPSKSAVYNYNFFAQDEIALDSKEDWLLTLGSKFEYYSLTDWEIQPRASLLWHFNDVHSFWISASRAVRTPARSQQNIQVFYFEELLAPDVPLMIQGRGNPSLKAENMIAYQLGWRAAFNESLTSDATLFFHDYKDITRTEPVGSVFRDANGFFVLPAQVDNNLDAQSYGAEISVNWQVTAGWRNYLAYSYFKLNAKPQSGHYLFATDSDERISPQQMASVRSQFKIAPDTDFDVWLRYTDSTESNGRSVNAYFDLDLRLAWRLSNEVELSLIGQNLIQTQHVEFDEGTFYPIVGLVERGVYGKLVWKFDT